MQSFLVNKSILFEQISKSRTFLIVDEDSLDDGDFRILAYFSLALKSLKLDNSLSKTRIKKIDGLSNKIEDTSVYLLGQLGKNEPYQKDIQGKEILEKYVFPLVTQAVKYVGGRIILIECANKEKLISFYGNNGFVYLQEDEYVQMIRFLV
ncbi:hypothetical protein DEAC_c41680 [Desulfosporosinus acididurans]|uniref:Acetyltransferase (GNAT) family protein n=1 Tax=Desulfosporosinus acididurans TaxID=476652 RepID=A0A0J1FKD7_9FIRM|nr:hypothetical protein DEAC_c41680 [Desulfosporosinus acididurans]